MVSLTAIKEVLKALFRTATTKYPEGPPSSAPEGLRGLPQFNEENCTGCGACAASCSAGAIAITDEKDTRKIEIHHLRCIFCGRCEDVCPDEGIQLSSNFELATAEKEQASVVIEFSLQNCQDCGVPITTHKHLAKIQERLMKEIDPAIKDTVSKDLPRYLCLCPECRQQRSDELNTHTKKFYSREWET